MIKLKLNQLTEKIHGTYQPDQYYISLGAFPKDTVKEILSGELEYESQCIDPEHNAYLTGGLQLGNTVYEYKIHVHSASDSDLTDGTEYLTEDQASDEINELNEEDPEYQAKVESIEERTKDSDDLEAMFMDRASEALACVDSPHSLTVYLTEVDTVPLSVSDLEPDQINTHECSQEDLEDWMQNNMGYCVVCGQFTRESVEPDAKEYECPQCENKTVFGAEYAWLNGYIQIK